jgi:hypothetical protein
MKWNEIEHNPSLKASIPQAASRLLAEGIPKTGHQVNASK